MHIFEVGDLAVAVRCVQTRGSSKQYYYVAAGLYECRQARAGHGYWAFVRNVGNPRRSQKLAKQDAESFSEATGDLPVLSIRHGSKAPIFDSAVRRAANALVGAA